MTAFVHTDGGRKAAGFKGLTGDCGVRALALTVYADLPPADAYRAACAIVARYAQTERKKRGRTPERSKSSVRGGVFHRTMRRIMADPEISAVGWRWRPTMAIGGGCTTHLRADELPSGTLLVVVSKHFTTVIDGVIHDNHNPSRDGTRCVYGFWYREI